MAAAVNGVRAPGPVEQPDWIPGLYGLRVGGWIPWDSDQSVRVARVNRFFGVAS
jgi:hypothetical protein